MPRVSYTASSRAHSSSGSEMERVIDDLRRAAKDVVDQIEDLDIEMISGKYDRDESDHLILLADLRGVTRVLERAIGDIQQAG